LRLLLANVPLQFFRLIRDSRLPAISALLAATTVAVATVSASRRTVSLGPGFIDVQRSAIEISAIQGVDGAVPFSIAAHFDKCEAAGLAGIAVRNNVDTIDGSVRFKHGTECFFGCAEAEISYENIFHSLSF